MRKRGSIRSILLIILFIVIIIGAAVSLFSVIPQKVYDDEYFGIETVKSEVDYNGNGVDDFTDILLGAREDAENKPKYIDKYYEGGYPPENEGVCTDLVWRAFYNAGYDLKSMVDAHIRANLDLYPEVNGVPDSNIDFRRVKNLKVFFENNTTSYSLDPNDIEEWQPGDIVIFGENYTHIGIISDKRNSKGIPYLIHNGGQKNREENMLVMYSYKQPITGHYRFE